jgi:hypothetical protein
MMFDLGIAAIASNGSWLRVAFHDGTHANFTHGLVDMTTWFLVLREDF